MAAITEFFRLEEVEGSVLYSDLKAMADRQPAHAYLVLVVPPAGEEGQLKTMWRLGGEPLALAQAATHMLTVNPAIRRILFGVCELIERGTLTVGT